MSKYKGLGNYTKKKKLKILSFQQISVILCVCLIAHGIQWSNARPLTDSSESVGSDELLPINPVIPLIIDNTSDDSSVEAYVDSSDEHVVKKRALSQSESIVAPVSLVSVVKHENVAVDDDSFEAAESSHIFRPHFRQRSVVEEDRVRRRKAIGAPAPAHGRKVRN